MALERRNPLPPGVYWQDFFTPPAGPKGGTIADFQTWLAGQRGSVTTLKTTESTTERGLQMWALFRVTAPVQWDAVRFGFPTIAPRGAATSEDEVIQRPDPEPDVAEQLKEALSPASFIGLAGEAFAVVVAVVGFVASIKYLPGRRRR